MKKFVTKYGYFASDTNEYVITKLQTPKPWVNVISNGTYGLVISQTGGGFSWNTHSEFNRLNRWHQDLVQDNWGKYFYFKNNATGEIWNPMWMPVKAELDSFECRYGSGYAKFVTLYKGIEIELTLFVPFEDDVEIWNFTLKNNAKIELDLSVFTYFEWCMGSSSDFHREFHKTFIETDFDSELNAMTATKRLWEIPLGDRGHWNIEYPYLGFITSTEKIVSFDGDKESFLGQYGDLAHPKAVISGNLNKNLGKWNDSIAATEISFRLKSSESKEFAYIIGIKEDKEAIKKSIALFNSPEKRKTSFQNVINKWNLLLGPLSVNTPDDGLNLLVNRWLRYQAIAGRLWGRTAYYQQSGAFGFRDQLQDSLVYLPIAPEKTVEQIRLHARHQMVDGTVLHWWHPISDTGLETKMTDDLLWLPFIINHYIDETADYSILDIEEPYYNNKSLSDSLFNHSVKAIEKVLTRYSERGLPLIGAGDWNDGLSAVGLEMKGESIWLAEFFYGILKSFSRLCGVKGNPELKEKYLQKAHELKTAFDKYAWDGEWYFRGTKDSGEKIGSTECVDGKIFLNAQTWSVITGIGEKEKQHTAMNSVTKHLLKKNGALLLAPAYRTPDKFIGYLSRYAPGRRENGGVYTHAATWAIQAYALLNDAENAFNAYKNLSPIGNGLDPDKYVAEPYVTPGNIDGPDSPNYGMGGWTWYTGSASWFQKMIVDFILGVRSTIDGLLIEPCIPANWKGYEVKRLFRGTTYFIEVINNSGVSSGVKEVIIDGVSQNSNLIKPVTNKAEVTVKVIL